MTPPATIGDRSSSNEQVRASAGEGNDLRLRREDGPVRPTRTAMSAHGVARAECLIHSSLERPTVLLDSVVEQRATGTAALASHL